MLDRRFKVWAIDYDSPYEAQCHAVSEIIVSLKTRYQDLEVLKTWGYGKSLILDGRIQSCEKDEYIYHESLVHPAMIGGRSSEKVLIIGGGEGATLREVLRYGAVREAVMVDIDGEVIEACKNHLPEFHRGSFDDPRLEIVIGDGREFIKDLDSEFDVIIIDISEPTSEGPAYLLYTREFYSLVRTALRKGGRVVTQACTSSVGLLDNFNMILNTMRESFGAAIPYHCFVPSFGTTWGFAMWSESVSGEDIIDLDVDGLIERAKVQGLRYYDAETHRAMFSLPRDIREALSIEERVLTDDNPPAIY